MIAILGIEPDLEFVGQGAMAEDAMRLAYAFTPDIIILDINMPGGGPNAAQSNADSLPIIKFVVLMGSNGDADVLNAFNLAEKHMY